MENYSLLENELTSLDQLGEFDTVGFDADHTLVKYNVREMSIMIDKCNISNWFLACIHKCSHIKSS